MRGWSLNLTLEGMDTEIDLPTMPLFETKQGPVIELIFWSRRIDRWVHAVADYFRRTLPRGHLQLTLGDCLWIEGSIQRFGEVAFQRCILELERFPFPREEN